MKILITGAAGFIGHALVKVLAQEDADIVGLDNINDYYTPRLKYQRLADCGIAEADICHGVLVQSRTLPRYRFIHLDLTEKDRILQLFHDEQFTHVVNLGGQAGVRYSIENPYSYIESNVMGFLNILEGCRWNGVGRLLYASSSSVYGEDAHVPFSEDDRTDSPVSLYAATKKSDEVMAHAYSKLFGFETVGLRFFTVYGPWGRPDMAPIKFMRAITSGQPIDVYNEGHMLRDFTYIDDIVRGIMLILQGASFRSRPSSDGGTVPATIYNIGNSQPIHLLDFIHTIEDVTGHKADMHLQGMQPGDVTRTYADCSRLEHDFGYHPSTTLREGIARLWEWFQQNPV